MTSICNPGKGGSAEKQWRKEKKNVLWVKVYEFGFALKGTEFLKEITRDSLR